MNLAALTFRDFRLYLIGNIFALNAMWMQRVTIAWLAWEMTRSASFVGFVAFVNFAPTIVIGPFFGVLVDRIRIRRAAMITQTAMCLLALMIFAGFFFGWMGPALLATISGLLGVASAAHHPVRMSLAPRLVDLKAVASVVSFTAINFNLARMIGPALGGWVIAGLGVGPALLLQALFYLPFIFILTRLNPRARTNANTERPPFLQDMATGISHVLQTPLIRRAILITGVGAFVTRGLLEILPVIADGVFNRGATGLGLLTSAAGLGALLAGVSKALMSSQAGGRLPRLALVATTFGIALVSAVGLSTSWVSTLLLVAILGFTATMTGISMQTAIQIELDDTLRGRVMSLWVLVGIGASACGAVALGVLADWVGLAPTLAGIGSIGALGLAIYVRRIW